MLFTNDGAFDFSGARAPESPVETLLATFIITDDDGVVDDVDIPLVWSHTLAESIGCPTTTPAMPAA